MKKVEIGAILAGGTGKRLKPVTDEIPKPLLEIKDGYSILDKQLLQFKYAGINEVYLLVGHLYKKIKQKYGDEWNGLNIHYLVEKKPSGTSGAFYNLFNEIDESVVVRNGDVVTDINLKEMIKKSKDMTMFVVPMQSNYGIVKESNGKILEFEEKPLFSDKLINGGIYVIDNNIRKFFDVKEGDVEELVFPKIVEDGLMYSYKEDCFWRSIDSIKDLEEVRNEFKNRTDKPWGYERIIVSTDKYLTKELYIMKGEGTSFHYHPRKDETIHVMNGECIIDFGNRKVVLRKNQTIRIKPNTKHSMIAVKNTLLQEYSTPYPNDTIRIKDRYKR